MVRTNLSHGSRVRAVSIAAVLLLAGLALGALPAAEAKGPGRILVVEGSSGLTAASLGTITPPVPPCGTAPCFDVVSPAALTAFTPTNYGPYSVLYVGWDPTPAALAALQNQAGNIAQWIGAGGSVIASSEAPAVAGQGGFKWLPNGNAITVASYGSNVMQLTTVGVVHPATAGVTAGDLSGWSSSTHVRFTAWPSWLSALAKSGAGHEITLAGHYGQGCVVATGQDVDWHAAAGHAGAQKWLRELVDWAYSCECVPYACEPTITLTGPELVSYRPDTDAAWLLSDADSLLGTALFEKGDHGETTSEPRFLSTLTVTVDPCRCIVKKVELISEVTNDVVPVNDGLFPTLSQPVGFTWTVTSPDLDTYDVTFRLTLECPNEDGTTTDHVFEKSWVMGP